MANKDKMKDRTQPVDKATGKFLPTAGIGSLKMRAVFDDKRTVEHKAIQTVLDKLVEQAGGPANVTDPQWDILRRIRKLTIDMYMYEKWLYSQEGLVDKYGRVPQVQSDWDRSEKRYDALVLRFTALIVDEKSDYDKALDAMAKRREDDKHKGSEEVG